MRVIVYYGKLAKNVELAALHSSKKVAADLFVNSISTFKKVSNRPNPSDFETLFTKAKQNNKNEESCI